MPLRRKLAPLFLAGVLVLAAVPALAQLAHHPFAVGANEGAVGHQSGLGAWILTQTSTFFRALTEAVTAVKGGSGLPLLLGLSFAYGVFHAAGPGHGKAVITAYLVSNEVALRRGLVIALLAALLQGVVAVSIVSIAALVFNATGPRMTAAAQAIELASYLAIIGLGLTLVWRKGCVFAAAFRKPTPTPILPLALATASGAAGPGLGTMALRTTAAPSRFAADDGTLGHVHDAHCGCGHAHMPDPALFADKSFDWKAAATAVVVAGARPCSGAILVLVFALSQGILAAGVAATFAMALGTAITTGMLAITAVFAKGFAMRLSGGKPGRALVVGRLVELGAAACVLLFGIALLAAALSGVQTTA